MGGRFRGAQHRHAIETRSMSYPRRVVSMALVVSMLLSRGALDTGWAETAAAAPLRSSPSSCNRAAFRVIVDVGHTVDRHGVLSARGTTEYRFNLRLANRIEQMLVDAGFGKTVELITAAPPPRGLFERAARANNLRADLFLSIHHDGVPDAFVERWEYDGSEHSFSDRFRGHAIFISYDNGDPTGSLRFGRLLGNQLKARGLQYTPHYAEKFMGNRQRKLVDAEPGGGLKRSPPHPSPFQGEGGVCVTPQLNATARICCALTRPPASAAARHPSRSRA